MASGQARFDALEEAERQWRAHDIDNSRAMHAVISIVHARQLLVTAIDLTLKPLDLTFARYEILMLLRFSSGGAMPITKMGQRLLIHPTGVTRLVDKLEEQGFVSRRTNPDDRRSTLVHLEPAGHDRSGEATRAVTDIEFGFSLQSHQLDTLIELLASVRHDIDTADDN